MSIRSAVPATNIILSFMVMIMFSCNNENQSLPYLGEKQIEGDDTIYYSIPPFSYVDQDSTVITNDVLAGKAYVADFFFTSCPTICPKVKQQMLRLQDQFNNPEALQFLSLSIDYRRDSVPVLSRYADKLGISSDQWHLVQLQKEQVDKVANQYFNIAFEDDDAPGGFDHSGRLILIDKNGHVRAHCNGTDPESVDGFAKDIKKLLNEG